MRRKSLDKKSLIYVLFIVLLIGCSSEKEDMNNNGSDRIGGGTTTTTITTTTTTIQSSYFKWVSDITIEDYYGYVILQYLYTNTNVKIKGSNVTIIALTEDLENYEESFGRTRCHFCPNIKLFDKTKDTDNNITIIIKNLYVEWSLIGEIIKSMQSSKELDQSLIDEKTVGVETEVMYKNIWYYLNNGYNLYQGYTDRGVGFFDVEVTINNKSFNISPSNKEWTDFLVSERNDLVFPEMVNITLIRKGCRPYQRGFYRYLVPITVFKKIKEFKDTLNPNLDITKPRPVLVIDKQETWMRVFARQEDNEEIGSCVTQK